VGGIALKKSKEKNGGAINPPSNPAETISDESDIGKFCCEAVYYMGMPL